MQLFNITIKRYETADLQGWDAFVDKAKNGTFLFKRAYMDYHAHRFEDFSLLIFDSGKLIALLPANGNGKTVYSHQGLTYGSLLIATGVSQTLVLAIFDALKVFLKAWNIETLYYKPVPAIYHRYCCEEDLYALFRNDARLVARGCSTTFCIQKPNPSLRLRLTRIAKYADTHNLRYEIHPNVDAFWDIIATNLAKKHHIAPVHSQAEMNLLQSLFPKYVQSIAVYAGNEIVAGGVVYLVNDVAHLQYAAVSSEGERMYAGEYLYDLCIHQLFMDFRYFDFGISSENGGQFLNEGLIAYKEKFGGHTVVYDHYEMLL
ncbi:MAG: GNAT family N-acetyltransferase [Bacteroidales bacterium]|jgi:hypothetical protein|nr:GNAT family N-acetyltransferase [Bacteroidales bacterium]